MRRWIPWVVSVALSVGLIAYLLSQIDPREILRTALRLEPRLLAAFAALTLLGVLARAVRFWILLGRRVRLKILFAVTLARGLFIDLVPARLGELSYVYLLVRSSGRPLEEALSSLMLAVLFDIVAIGPLIVLAVIVVGGGEGLPVAWLIVLSIALAVAAYVGIRLAEPVAGRVARVLGEGTASGWRRRFADKLGHTAQALGETRRRGVFLPVLGVSAIVRLCKFGSYYFLFLAVMAPYGYTIESVGFFRVFLGVLGAELAAALPVHGIAGFGTFEGVWAFTFTRLGFSREHAIISGFLAHALSQLTEYTLGALALVWLMRPGSRGRARPDAAAGASAPGSDRP